ncbi:MAG TPA: hypothetical protein EYO61_01295, partial [Campylobacterales bacterium]|nr:hypothetical protein [Campylobacterales bacterium]
MALTGEQKSEIVSKFQRKEGDTGSPEVQIALLTTILFITFPAGPITS